MKSSNRLKKLIIILLILSSIGAIIGSAYLVSKKNTDTRSDAASDSTVKVYFESASKSVTNGKVEVNIFLESVTNVKISAAAVPITVSTQFLTLDKTAFSDSQNQANAECRAQNFKLDTSLSIRDDGAGNYVLNRASLKATEELPSGKFCFGTLTLNSVANGSSNVVFKATNNSSWQIVGPTGALTASLTGGAGSITIQSSGPTATAPTNPTATAPTNAPTNPTVAPSNNPTTTTQPSVTAPTSSQSATNSATATRNPSQTASQRPSSTNIITTQAPSPTQSLPNTSISDSAFTTVLYAIFGAALVTFGAISYKTRVGKRV